MSHPWISLEIKKLMRKRNKKYRSMKKKGSDTLKEEVRLLKKEIRRKIRRAHWNSINRLFAGTVGQAPYGRMKKFWSYVKRQRKSNFGVPPLKENGMVKGGIQKHSRPITSHTI